MAGGGTTLVEGSRLGFKVTGVDLNPVAWFIVKNELACSDPAQVKAFFDEIEAEVKPQIQPFYTTTCPKGHKGRWIDVRTDQPAPANLDPINLAPTERKHYRWEGPEVIYTFWAKHGPCAGSQGQPCGHRTPIFRSPVIAEKKLTAHYIPVNCPACGYQFHAELGETRLAPSAERVIVERETPFTEVTQSFAQELKDYTKGAALDKRQRVERLLVAIDAEPGFECRHCQAFAGGDVIPKASIPDLTEAMRVSFRTRGLVALSPKRFKTVRKNWRKCRAGLPWGDGEVHRPWENRDMVLNALRDAKADLERAGVKLNVPFTLTTFRKSFAQNHADCGTPPRTLATLLGHTETRMTMRFYNRVTDANQRAAAATMDQILGLELHCSSTGARSEGAA